MTDSFDPADAGCWMARGRPAHHAHALADAWRRFPDLPNDAPLDARITHSRERIQALRPLTETIAQETERQRVAANSACSSNCWVTSAVRRQSRCKTNNKAVGPIANSDTFQSDGQRKTPRHRCRGVCF